MARCRANASIPLFRAGFAVCQSLAISKHTEQACRIECAISGLAHTATRPVILVQGLYAYQGLFNVQYASQAVQVS